MADVLAGVTAFASIVGLADVCCRLAESLYRSTCTIKNAPQSIQGLSERLGQLHTLLEDVDRLLKHYRTSSPVIEEGFSPQAIKASLDACLSELTKVKALMAKFDNKGGKVDGFSRRAKWILDEHKLEGHCNTLEHLASRISLALSVAGWSEARPPSSPSSLTSSSNHDISTSESHRKLGTQLVDLHTSLAGTQLKVSTESANIQNSLSQISGEVGRSQDSIQTQLHVTRDTVCRQVLQSGNTVAQMTGAMHGDLHRLHHLNRRSQQRVQKELRQLSSILDQLSSLHLETQKGNPIPGTAQFSGLENMAFVLLQMRSTLEELISDLRSTGGIESLNQEVDLLLDEYKRLVDFYHESGASNDHEIIDNQGQNPNKWEATLEDYSLGLQDQPLPKTMKKIYSCREIHVSHIGRLEVRLERIVGDSNDLPTTSQRASFHFIPQGSVSSAGIYASFCKTYQLARHPYISRTLREIRRLGLGDIRNKLETALIHDDLPTIQQMLSFGQIKPWYRFQSRYEAEARRGFDGVSNHPLGGDNAGGGPYEWLGLNLIEVLYPILWSPYAG